MLAREWLVILVLQSAGVAGRCADVTRPLSTVAEARELIGTQAQDGLEVRLRGVVTYYDPGAGILAIQDNSGGIFIRPSWERLPVQAGEEVEVLGAVVAGRSRSIIVARELKAGAKAALPQNPTSPLHTIDPSRQDGQWVETQGEVRAVGEDAGRIRLKIAAEGRQLTVVVLNLLQQDQQHLLGATIRVGGVLANGGGLGAAAGQTELLVPSLAQLVVAESGPEDPFASSLVPIGSVPGMAASPGQSRRVKVRARVLRYQPWEWIEVADGTGELRALTRQAAQISTNTWLEIVGFPAKETNQAVLEDALIRRIGVFEAGAGTNTAGLPQLVSVTRIRELPVAEAARGYPVRLRGVVTYYDRDWGNLFFEGATEGIYVETQNQPLDLNPGQLVVLHGRTAPGEFAPVVSGPWFEIQGSAPMPSPKPATFEEMMSGKFDSQWIETVGVVHSITSDSSHLFLTVASGAGEYQVLIPSWQNKALPTEWMDAEVRLQAACGSLFNGLRQLTGIQLFVPEAAYVTVLHPAKTEPSSQPPEPIASLLQFRHTDDPRHWVHIRGVVTLQRRNGTFFVQDHTGGVLAQPETPVEVRAGEEVDLAGFPTLGAYTPVLRHARVWNRGPGQIPAPVRIAGKETLANLAASGRRDSQLVSLQGRIFDLNMGVADETLILQDEDSLFQAVLEGQDGARPLSALRRGAVVEVTGVCSFEVDESRNPVGFHIQLRSPGDVRVLKAAPWWTLRHTLLLSGALGSAILGAVAWAMALQRRVERQTRLIRQRLENEASLERRFHALIEHAADQLFVHDSTGKLLIVNEQSCTSLMYTREELLRLNITDVQEVADSHPPIRRWQTMAPGETLNLAGFHKRKDGSRFPVEVRVGVFEENGQRTFLAVARDVTERQNLESQLRQAQKMESIGQLAGGIAHDFNNILTVIQGHGSLLELAGRLEGEDLDAARQISDAARRAAHLTRQLLAFGRRHMLQLGDLDLNSVVSSLSNMLQRVIGEDVALEVQCAAGLPMVRADNGMMEQVLVNLAVNARDAMPKGGKMVVKTVALTITAEAVQQSPEAVLGPAVCLEVSDTGCGIPPDLLPRIFEPFFTTKEVGKGTGLGLATVYGIVKQHRGWIRVSSQVNQGTTFQIFLPALAQSKPVPIKAIEPPAAAHGRQESILVVEDETALRDLVVRVLSRQGYRVHAAGSAAEAKGVWRARHEEFDLLVTDILMPGGMTGRELADALQQEKPGLEVIFTSGYSTAVVGRDFELLEGINFLQKPYPPQVLVNLVRQCLDRSNKAA